MIYYGREWAAGGDPCCGYTPPAWARHLVANDRTAV